MPGPTLAPFAATASLPAAVDTVVIGGGIIGVATALELADRGLRVAVCEKGEIAGEQSSRNWGWVRIARRDPREIALVAVAQRLWQDLDRRLGEATGYTQSGIVFSAKNEDEEQRYVDWLREAEPWQVHGQMIGRQQLDTLFPGMQTGFSAALHVPTDGRAEPQLATPAMARGVQQRGGHVLTNCAVRGVETAAGAVSGVVTERGRIGCQSVVLAGGAWSSLFGANLGIDLPQLKILNSVLRTSPVPDGPSTALWSDRFSFRRRSDGGYTIAGGYRNRVDIVPDSFRYFRPFLPALRAEWRSLSLRVGRRSLFELSLPRHWPLDQPTVFERERVLDPTPWRRHPDDALAALQAACPAFREATAVQHWAGLIDVTPDAVPVMSAVDSLPGFYIATGFSGHGFGIGPGAGVLMADLVSGRTPVVDPTPFRFSRFSDGSPITIMAGF